MASKYFQRTAIRRRSDGGDVESGLRIGSEIGKLLGGLAGAIKSSQQDALANKLMNTENAPRAALVSPGGKTITDSGGPQPGGPQPGDTVDPNADLSTDLPEDVSSVLSTKGPPSMYTNPSTGNIDPAQGTEQTYSGTNTDPLADNVGAAKTAAALPSTKYVPNVIPAGVSTAGTQPFRGGVEGMKLQQEFQRGQMADQIARLKLADAQANASGTGRYALDIAYKRAQMAKLQADTQQRLHPKPTGKETKPTGKETIPPAENIGSEPVTNQEQLAQYIDGKHGKGSAANMANTLMEDEKVPDPKGAIDPATREVALIDNPSGPKISADRKSITLGPKNKRMTMSVELAQNYVKQLNALQIRQGAAPYRVPGEDQSIGADKEHPYEQKTNLDAFSRQPGTWIKLLDGRITTVPRRRF